jgi:hypothetical protein
MKMVLNKAFGGFGCYVDNEKAKKFLALYKNEESRNNAKLVEFVETHVEECTDLRVVELSDNTTDWEILNSEGWESVVYVVDGKIHWA